MHTPDGRTSRRHWQPRDVQKSGRPGLQLSSASVFKMNNGVEIPVLGIGLYQSPAGRATQEAVRYALEAGYRLLDTAQIYGNERDVGQALRESGLRRDEVFITTKLWNDDHGYNSTIQACEESLRRLGLSHLDLYLVHWPVQGLRRESWKAMAKLLKEGKCRSVGVSNYTIRHLSELLHESDTVPSVNQVEFHPFLYQEELLEYCRGQNILLEAYSPLTRGKRLDHPKIQTIAREHRGTPAQVLIRWALQHSLAVIPKSVHRDRILENSRVFDFTLSAENMEVLDSLNENYRTCWDPTNVP